MDILQAYQGTISAMGAMSLLLFCQLLVADAVGIRSGHIPGAAIATDHDNLLFRVTRTVANSNESIAIFILAVVFCIFAKASPQYTGYAAWGFVMSRAAYALCYYFNIKLLRSIIFGVALICLAALMVLGFLA
ncbi:Uncharacterised protein [Halioglobus japonicus]|nr:Uncharacterised protein [Halioglobus japonicus]